MNSPCKVVIGGFTSVQHTKPVPQRLTLELSAYAFARAHCVSNGITDPDDFGQVYKTIKDKFDKYALTPEQIRQRQLIFFPKISDIRLVNGQFEVADPKEPHLHIYDLNVDPRGADISFRLDSYGKIVEQVLEQMYPDGAQAPKELIHVTCTGYLAPSPVERLATRREWHDTTVVHCYNMACHAAFPAIKMAHGFIASSRTGVTPPREQVDIVHTELMSAHYNLTDTRAENIIAMSLFADGLIKYSLYSEEELRRQGMNGLRLLAMKEHLLPDSSDAMTEMPGPFQFHVSLSPMVPVIIKRHVRDFVVSLLEQAGIDFEREKRELSFAIHPGGPKIVEHIQESLGLTDDQVAISQSVLYENGNMSSATFPHVMKGVFEQVDVGTRVVGLGFGPGMTIAGLVMEKI